MDQGALERILSHIRRQKTHKPAAGPAIQTFEKIIQERKSPFRFRSEEEARCNQDIEILLDLGLIICKVEEGQRGVAILPSPSVKRTLGIK